MAASEGQVAQTAGDAATADPMIRLRASARRTLAAAGPRYSPFLDPKAPNLEIRPLHQAASALSLGSGLRERARELGASLRDAHDRDRHLVDELFARRTVTVSRLAEDLGHVADASTPGEARKWAMELRRHVKTIRQRLAAAEDTEYEELRALNAQPSGAASDDESKRAASQAREQLQIRLAGLRRLDEHVGDVVDFADGPEGLLLTRSSSILLLGEWGTGKTHFLCDFALQALDDGCPAVVVLANELRTDLDPLDAIAEATKLAASGAELVRLLESAGAARNRRALVMIDAVNESDRDAWRRRLPKLIRGVGAAAYLGLIVSCRTPFDQAMVPDKVRKASVELRHPGFEDQEFDAQLEFFSYYGLPALHVPLLTPEFSRPLFLRLMCEAVKELGKRSQKDTLRDITSGQKSMTYVLEYFVKKAGAEVEKAHGIKPKSCWPIMKGEPRAGRQGFAGVLAANRREWMTFDEAIDEVRAYTAVSRADAESIIGSMKAAGLLIEHSRYLNGAYIDVLMLPYQRFSDHVVARHLLDKHLTDVSSIAQLRRCFYANRRLGAVFVADRWGRQYAEPGIASALMIEFPERVKRFAADDTIRRELLYYLPRKRHLVSPFVETFLDGLYWRSTTGFSADTQELVGRLLALGPDIHVRTYEVLFALAVRDDGLLGSSWLNGRLRPMTMPERDIEWSEYLRTLDPASNPYQLLAWAEREDHTKVDTAVAERALRLISLTLTTTDRPLRDRATRALVLIGEAHPAVLFDVVLDCLPFNDPYVPERALAAAYGVCMRRLGRETARSTFTDSLAMFARRLLELVLRPAAPHGTWHTLTRGYAIGVLQVLLQLRPRALAAADRTLLSPAPGQARSPFRAASRISKADVADPEHAIRMDFGNYTIGHLVDGRSNYDMKHREYVRVRRQIADRVRRLGFSTDCFGELDRRIVEQMEYRRDGRKIDRYGKKYSWIAYFEMYGLRCAQGQLDELQQGCARSSDCDIDPSFPGPVPVWNPPRRDVFQTSPVDLRTWLAEGEIPAYDELLRLTEVDGHAGDWMLLEAMIHEEGSAERELRGQVSSVFAPESSNARLRAEVDAGRDPSKDGFPDLGSDYYTYHGEIPWSPCYGDDVRTKRGRPRRRGDRAFTYFDHGWKPGIPVEATCRYWAWESHHSLLNQEGTIAFPAPPIADALGLRVIGGRSDMRDRHGALATIYRRAPGPGFGSYFLYMRRDLIEEYAALHGLRFVQAVTGERSYSHRWVERGLPEPIRELLQTKVHEFSRVVGLDG